MMVKVDLRAIPERLRGWRIWLTSSAIVVLATIGWVRFGPLDEALLAGAGAASVTVTDRRGEVLYEPLGGGGTRTDPVSAGTLPPLVVEATLAAEDRRFFRHPGVDPLAIGRAMLHNVRAMHVVEGGSTISQQVAKMLLGSPSRTLRQKLREAVVALRLERRLSKGEILALYLNLAPYGNRITGIARASRSYFGVTPAQLTPAQAAFLASLPQRPGAFNPLRDPMRARDRQRWILSRMTLSGDVRSRALKEELQVRAADQPSFAMHFVEKVLATKPVGRVVRTTLDARLQREVAGIIEARKSDLLGHGAHSVAVAVLDNATGEWLAWEGSGDYFGTSFGGAIDGVSTPRQPGSTLKPFTYALAFESGQSPATVLADVPSHFPTAEPGVVYSPRNYDGRYRGPLLVRAALAGSENVPAVAMAARLGPESLLRLLRAAGFDTLRHTADYYGVGLTLGDAEVTLEQLVTAYAAFARGGELVGARFVAGRAAGERRRLVSRRTAFWIADILSDAAARAYAFGEGGSLDFPFPVAVKTGTSQAYRDNWTIGFTRDVTVGVWVGNFDRRGLRGSSGVTGAAPIFNSVMLAAVKRVRGTLPVGDATPVLEPTADVESLTICALSGARPSPWCPATRREWLPKEDVPRFCSWHHDGWIDWPPELRSWASSSGRPDERPAGGATKHASRFRVSSPADGATFLIDPTLRMEFQAVRLRAETAGRVSWRVDGRPVGSAPGDAGLEWSLVPGVHTITATDPKGRRDSVRIFVK